MSLININNVRIKGISACVPERVEYNSDFPYVNKDQLEKFQMSVGVLERHCAIHDGTICTSDLCYKSADKLIKDLGWDRNEIGLLVFVSHSQDYKLPATACILQNRLGLPKECMAFDVPLGCSGFVYGLGIIGSILSLGYIKKALLLVGNTQSVYASPKDKSTALLFGDAGSSTALEFDQTAPVLNFHFQSDGSGYQSLIVPDGGCRNPFNENSLVYEEFEEGIQRTRLHEKMDGMEVFSFASSSVPKSLKTLMSTINIESQDVDYLLLHQANKLICERIRKKLKFSELQTPYNIDRFGNTSGTSIPLLMVTEIRKELQTMKLNHLACGFGVGLSLGSVYFNTENVVVPELMFL